MGYEGHKWRYVGENEYCNSAKTIHRYNDLGIRQSEKRFAMTEAYKKYLENKDKQEDYQEFVQLKHKLEYQQKHYGAADELDIAAFVKLAQRLFPNGGAFYKPLFAEGAFNPIVEVKNDDNCEE